MCQIFHVFSFDRLSARVGDRVDVIDRTDDINVPPLHNVCAQFMLQYRTNYNAPPYTNIQYVLTRILS